MPIDKHPPPLKNRKPFDRSKYVSVDLNERLKPYPLMREKMIDLIETADANGGIEKADDVEELVVSLMKDLGHHTLQTWAESQCRKKASEFRREHDQAEDKGKKNSIGPQRLEKSRLKRKSTK